MARTQRQVAHILGLRSGAAVSKQLRSLTHRLASESDLREAVAAISRDLTASGRPRLVSMPRRCLRLVSMPDPGDAQCLTPEMPWRRPPATSSAGQGIMKTGPQSFPGPFILHPQRSGHDPCLFDRRRARNSYLVF
jgi:hypothetical protein